jgi:predicted ribosome-associated RNA-binding protein Tma20
VDTGAIKFVLQGANIMCPGLTSPGATIHTEVQLSVTASQGAVHSAGMTVVVNFVEACPACIHQAITTAICRLSLRAAGGQLGQCMGNVAVSRRPLCGLQVKADAPVAIYAEGKEHAMAVGITKMSTKDMREVNKGIGVDNLHFLTDGLWRLPRLD